MNSLFMLNLCGVVIHIGTYKMRYIRPIKGKNFEHLMEGGTDKNRFIYSEIQNLTNVHERYRARLSNLSVENMPDMERFVLVTQQDVTLPATQYFDLLGKAISMVKTCLGSLV